MLCLKVLQHRAYRTPKELTLLHSNIQIIFTALYLFVVWCSKIRICSCLVYVTVCFVLHSVILENIFVLLELAHVLQVGNSSNEELNTDVNPKKVSNVQRSLKAVYVERCLQTLTLIEMTILTGLFECFSIFV